MGVQWGLLGAQGEEWPQGVTVIGQLTREGQSRTSQPGPSKL